MALDPFADSPFNPPRELEPPPSIKCVAGELPRMVREGMAALLASGIPVYQRANLVAPVEQEYTASDGALTHSAALRPLAKPTLLKLLAEAAHWVKWNARNAAWVRCDPPDKLVEIILANHGSWPFPVVRGVLTSPTLRPNGSVLALPGYDPASRYYLMFPTGLAVPPIPDRPTMEQARAALQLLDGLLDGYAFIEDDGVSRSVALAILMTQVLRCGMGVAPLLAVSATAPGSGKSHLVDLASAIAIGRACPIMGPSQRDEETEKRIDTMLLSGVAGFSIDNVHRLGDFPTLNTATERPQIGIRQFGTLDRIEVENSSTIYMTGNNLPVVGEQVRRTLLASMDAGEEQPEQREFPKGDPIAAVLANRGAYIAAILTVARGYITRGSRPPGLRPFGSYPDWSRLVREPLVWLGKADPVKSQEKTRESDPEMNRLRSLIIAWDAAFGTSPRTLASAALFALTQPLQEHDPDDEYENERKRLEYEAACAAQVGLRDVLMEHWPKGKEVDTTKMGYWLRGKEGRVANRLRFIKDEGSTHGTIRWKLSP